MTPEVKARIEQIGRGEVPEGYKKTDIGTIPSSWSVSTLGTLINFKNGINAEKEAFGHGTKLISVVDVLSDKPIYYETIKGSISVSENKLKEFSVTYGDILFQRSSEDYEDVGTANVYLDKDKAAVFSGFVIRGKKVENYHPIYLNALMHTGSIRKEIIRHAAGVQHINISQDSLAMVQVGLAESSEQNRIAEILTTQDKIIELKENLLIEKQRQKKYLMQQLLTGKKRLPGFGGVWETIRLRQIVKRNAKRNTIGNTNVLTISAQYGLINQAEFFNKAIASDDKSNYFLLE